jgi:hypothetical protein
MSEGHGDPGADVRSFLPRPGEPVEQYAERLRGLHRDLTLVLQAVERGLAAALRDDAPPPAGDEPAPVEIVPREPAEPQPTAPAQTPPAREGVRRGAPRVEVLPAPWGERRRADAGDAAEAEDEARAAETWVEREAETESEREPVRPPRFPARPSAATALATAEPEWVEREPGAGESFTAATFGPPPAREAPAPVLVAGLVAGWLTVLALVLALLLG